jgi:hypothetical protein
MNRALPIIALSALAVTGVACDPEDAARLLVAQSAPRPHAAVTVSPDGNVQVVADVTCHDDDTWSVRYTASALRDLGAWSAHGMYSEPTEWRGAGDVFTFDAAPMPTHPDTGSGLVLYYSVQDGAQWLGVGFIGVDDPGC